MSFGDLVGWLGASWRLQIALFDGRPVTVGTVVTALLIVLIGYFLAAWTSNRLGRVLSSRFRVEQGAAHALERLSFYGLLIVITLFALRTVNVPLTIFTLAGGALAIGIGFGSQNVMNNFISGLILLLERPVKAGDLIEVEGTFGTVERIGARSTRVRASDNTHLIVPNSSFLESVVRNWTHSDDIIRAQVNVGVIYGSPTREVAKLIRRAIEEHREVLPEREPIVIFTGFGESSLDFESYFWIRTRNVMKRRRIEGEIRFRIDDLFREAGIVIAFPQRDVHLDTATPLQVEIRERGG